MNSIRHVFRACAGRQGIQLAVLAGLMAPLLGQAEIARPGHIDDLSMRYDQAAYVMAHNAFNHAGLPNQTLTIAQQLARGVRGFMLDVHYSGGELKVCHSVCNALVGRVDPLQDDLRTIALFLEANPHAVVTVHMEMPGDAGVTRDRLHDFIGANATLFARAFNPDHARWSQHTQWPRLEEMIAANQRLVLMVDRAELSGPSVDGSGYLFHDQDILVQNTYRLGWTIGSHDYSCSTRWADIPLDTATGLRGWRRLFLMNHFHAVPERYHGQHDNRWDRIEARALDHCGPEAKREPNFIAVDFIHEGDALEYVEHRNNGGIVAYEGPGASQGVVCGFSSVIGRSWSLQDDERLGCENDEMKSLVLRGMKRGQRVTFYDRPDGYRNDDFGVLSIDQDIPWDAPQVVYRLEQSQLSPYFRYKYSGGNGLDGKVSRIVVDPNPMQWTDAAFTLHPESNGEGRVTCGFGAYSSRFWNLKNEGGCHNDDARSLRILTADRGTVIQVYDSPSGSTGDDYTTITVKREILFPVVVPSLETSFETADLSVIHHRKNGLNGKVSGVRVSRQP